MRLNVNDDCGSRVLAVVRLDGTPAVENEDYAKWEGASHKNGKWSYTEGGIDCANAVVAVLRRDTHAASNNIIKMLVVENSQQVSEVFIGKIAEISQPPVFDGQHASAMKACWEAVLASVKPETRAAYEVRVASWRKFNAV